MATVWSAPKQEYGDAIYNMDPQWARKTLSAKERDEALSLLAKMVWYFKRSISGKFSNPDNKAVYTHTHPYLVANITISNVYK